MQSISSSYLSFIYKMSPENNSAEEGTTCDICGVPIDACTCSCPYCGERDSCECCLYDAATGGG
jgi:hypothetical protein